MKKRINKKGVSLKWKLFAYFIFFIILTVFIIWLFQIKLLNNFYQDIRLKEVEVVCKQITGSIEDTDLNDVVLQYASEYGICVRIFKIEDTKATEIVSVEGSGRCFVHFMSYDDMSLLYDKALDNNGNYVQILKFNPFKKVDKITEASETFAPSVGIQDTDDDIRNDLSGEDDRNESDKSTILRTDEFYASAVYINAYTSKANNRYAILMNADLLPIASIVRTLEMQFFWIVVIMLLSALFFAFLISRNIATPISKINQSAKIFAEGEYDVKFSGDGCKETRELASTLNYAANELSKNDHLQKELIANISHDLRTPLTMICGYSEVMRDIPGENSPENVQVIIDEAMRMSELVTDLLDISKIQSGARKPEMTVFDITETVNEVMLRYKKLIDHDGYIITFKSEDSINVTADRVMILQVIYNLINNAINYCGDDKTITVIQTVNKNKVKITVADNGIGIEPERIPYIWDRYYKVDRVHKRATVGTGLGLSIVKEILEKHDAEYGVLSTPGVGSAFWFELKIAGLGFMSDD